MVANEELEVENRLTSALLRLPVRWTRLELPEAPINSKDNVKLIIVAAEVLEVRLKILPEGNQRGLHWPALGTFELSWKIQLQVSSSMSVEHLR